jgi:phage FluMu protein Com
MSIEFVCDHCGKTIKAPEVAAGKRGKCPHCSQANDVPVPVTVAHEGEVFDVAPLDDEDERQRELELRRLMDQERELLAESREQQAIPLEQIEDLRPEHLHHFVVNYCRDMADGKLDRTKGHVSQLYKFRLTAMEAVDEFLAGKVSEPALGDIPPRVLQGFLKSLQASLK